MQQYDPEAVVQEPRNRLRGFKGWRIGTLFSAVLALVVVWSSWLTVQSEETGAI